MVTAIFKCIQTDRSFLKTLAEMDMTSPTEATAVPSGTDQRNIVRRKLTGYVGFANLPNQWHRKSVRKGFIFNVMVVGMLFRILCSKRSTVV